MSVAQNDLLVGPVTPGVGVTLISIDFYFENSGDLEVYKSGSNTPLVETTDYTVTVPTSVGATNGSITLTVAADGVDRYSIYLKQPLRRSADLQFRGDLRSPVLNLELDRLWRAVQGINTALDRVFRFSQTSSVPSPLDAETPASRADKIIGFSPDGSGLALIVTPSELQTLAGLSDEIAFIGSAEAEITALNAITDEILILAPISTDITEVAGIAADVTALAGGAGGTITGNFEVTGEWDFTTVRALRLPVGTTAERPPAPAEGDVRRNTTTGLWEGYDGSNWVSLGQAKIEGNAKAWGAWVKDTPVVEASFNVASVTNNNTGQNTLTFTNSFTTAFTCAAGACLSSTLARLVAMEHGTTFVRTSVFTDTGGRSGSWSNVSVHGELA